MDANGTIWHHSTLRSEQQCGTQEPATSVDKQFPQEPADSFDLEATNLRTDTDEYWIGIAPRKVDISQVLQALGKNGKQAISHHRESTVSIEDIRDQPSGGLRNIDLGKLALPTKLWPKLRGQDKLRPPIPVPNKHKGREKK